MYGASRETDRRVGVLLEASSELNESVIEYEVQSVISSLHKLPCAALLPLVPL